MKKMERKGKWGGGGGGGGGGGCKIIFLID